MTFGKLFYGISLLAFGVADAGAQTNTSEVSQTGTKNSAAVDNTRAGNDFNQSTVIQNGLQNTAVVLQVGSFNVSHGRQIGDFNIVLHTQHGFSHRAESYQDNNSNQSAIRQRGEFNSAFVEQIGRRNLSQITQGAEGSSSDYNSTTFFEPGSGVVRTGNSNRTSVKQVGDDLVSTVRQRAASGGIAAHNNSATVIQRGSGGTSTVLQESRGNSATVFQFQGGSTDALRNSTSIVQRNASAVDVNNPMSENRANVAVNGTGNGLSVVQNGRFNSAEATQGLGQRGSISIVQTGTGSNRAAVAQYGNSNALTIAQHSAGAEAVVWQQAGPVSGRNANNSGMIDQGAGATATAAFSRTFFGNTAPSTGGSTSNLRAELTQGNNQATVLWNITQIAQDGVNLSANVVQRGSGTEALANIVRIGQQGGMSGSNTAIAIQQAATGPSRPEDSAATGTPGDPFFFAGGSRSAEIVILQSGSSNSANVDQRGRGQYGRIEQGAGSGNNASILQDVGATNATAVIIQTGDSNLYNVVQTDPNQYIIVRQTGYGNAVTDVVRRGPGS